MLLFSQNTTLELSTLQIVGLQSCSWSFPPFGLLPLAVCINGWERSNLSRNDVSDYLGRQRGNCPRSKELGVALPHSFCLKCWRFKNTYVKCVLSIRNPSPLLSSITLLDFTPLYRLYLIEYSHGLPFINHTPLEEH